MWQRLLIILGQVMIKLITQIKEKMNKEGLTAYSLEKNAGLKPNAVHNIISGRSKNPSINVLQTIAKTLNCSVSDLIGEEEVDSSVNLDNQETVKNFDSSKPQVYENKELYIKCLIYFCSLLKDHKCWLEREKILSCVDEFYLYSFKKGLNKVDVHFAKWIFEKIRI